MKDEIHIFGTGFNAKKKYSGHIASKQGGD
jgi:hypothetical protein